MEDIGRGFDESQCINPTTFRQRDPRILVTELTPGSCSLSKPVVKFRSAFELLIHRVKLRRDVRHIHDMCCLRPAVVALLER